MCQKGGFLRCQARKKRNANIQVSITCIVVLERKHDNERDAREADEAIDDASKDEGWLSLTPAEHPENNRVPKKTNNGLERSVSVYMRRPGECDVPRVRSSRVRDDFPRRQEGLRE